MSDPALQPEGSSSSPVSELPPATLYTTSIEPSPTIQTDPPPPYPEPYPSLKPGENPTSYETFPESGPVEEAIKSSEFDDNTVRRAFIRKVFSLVFLQLLFTFSVVCVFTFSSVVKKAIQSSLWPYMSSFIIFAVVLIPLTFWKSLNRRHPWNLIALMVVTVTLSYMVGTIASYHDTVIVILTMGATLAIALAIIFYSLQTRWDFSLCYGLFLVLSVDLVMFGVFSTFYYNHMAQVAYGTLGALLFALFLLVDVQWTMNERVNPDEYVSAALFIYLDVVLIFLYLLGRR